MKTSFLFTILLLSSFGLTADNGAQLEQEDADSIQEDCVIEKNDDNHDAATQMLENGASWSDRYQTLKNSLPENGTLQSNMMYAGVGALAGLFLARAYYSAQLAAEKTAHAAAQQASIITFQGTLQAIQTLVARGSQIAAENAVESVRELVNKVLP